jgi:hypothetical protein
MPKKQEEMPETKAEEKELTKEVILDDYYKRLGRLWVLKRNAEYTKSDRNPERRDLEPEFNTAESAINDMLGREFQKLRADGRAEDIEEIYGTIFGERGEKDQISPEGKPIGKSYETIEKEISELADGTREK